MSGLSAATRLRPPGPDDVSPKGEGSEKLLLSAAIVLWEGVADGIVSIFKKGRLRCLVRKCKGKSVGPMCAIGNEIYDEECR